MRAAMVVALLAGALASGDANAQSAAGPAPSAPWTPQQAKRVFERVIKRGPFLGSEQARSERATVDRFFHVEDYAVLRGNPVMGFWDAGRFRWRGTRVAWDGVVSVAPSARAITRRAWDAAFEEVARTQGLIVDPRAPIRIRGACVDAVVTPTADDPNPGVLLEIRIDSPTGPFRYRIGMGKPTIEDAIGAGLDWVIGFARAIGESEIP